MTSFPSMIGGDDPMGMIYDHLENPLPFNQTESAARNYTCRPTPLRYRVLGNPEEPCPLEAKLNEPGPSLCCTSRRTGDETTNGESLAYLRMLNQVFRRIPLQNRARIPPNSRRVMKWIENLMETPEIPGNPSPNIMLDTQDPQFLSIVKLVLVTASTVHVRARENNADFPIVQHGNAVHFVYELSSVNSLLLQAVNEVGVEGAYFTPTLHTPATPTSPIYPVRAESTRVYTLDGLMAPIDLAEIVSHIEIANILGWDVRNLRVDHEAVVGATTSTISQCLRLVQAFKNFRAHGQTVRIKVGNPRVVPLGFSTVHFNPNDMLAFVTTLLDSVNGTNLLVSPHHSYSFNYSYADSMGINRTNGINVQYWSDFEVLYFSVTRV